MIIRRVLVLLVAAALVLPIATVLLIATGQLLLAMQDTVGAAVLGRLSLAGGLLWVLTLACLVIVQGLDRLGPPPGPPEGPSE